MMGALAKLGKFGWFTVNAFVSFCTILSAYIGYVDPHSFAFLQVIGMTFPFWVIALLLLLVADLFVARRMTLMLLTTIVICLKPFLTYYPLNIGSPKLTSEDSTRVFKVLTYNVFGFRDRTSSGDTSGNSTYRFIIDSDADIVCLQEGEVSFRHPSGQYKAQMDSISRRYPYILNDKNDGDILLSKYPAKIIPTPQPDWGSGRFSAYRLDVEGRELCVINCHLQSIGLTPEDKELYKELTNREIKNTKTELKEARRWILPKLSEAFRMRAEQADMIKQLVDSIGGNVILTGDFNDVPGNYAYRTIRSAGLKDAYSEVAFLPTFTYNDNRFYFRIDHILYMGDMKPVKVKRGDNKSSDHYPLFATFLWNE